MFSVGVFCFSHSFRCFSIGMITGSTDALRKTIQRARPTDSADIAARDSHMFIGKNMETRGAFSRIYSLVQYASDGQLFLLHDTHSSAPWPKERIVIFSSDVQLKVLKACSTIFADSTFSVVSGFCNQMLVIHGEVSFDIFFVRKNSEKFFQHFSSPMVRSCLLHLSSWISTGRRSTYWLCS